MTFYTVLLHHCATAYTTNLDWSSLYGAKSIAYHSTEMNELLADAHTEELTAYSHSSLLGPYKNRKQVPAAKKPLVRGGDPDPDVADTKEVVRDLGDRVIIDIVPPYGAFRSVSDFDLKLITDNTDSKVLEVHERRRLGPGFERKYAVPSLIEHTRIGASISASGALQLVFPKRSTSKTATIQTTPPSESQAVPPPSPNTKPSSMEHATNTNSQESSNSNSKKGAKDNVKEKEDYLANAASSLHDYYKNRAQQGKAPKESSSQSSSSSQLPHKSKAAKSATQPQSSAHKAHDANGEQSTDLDKPSGTPAHKVHAHDASEKREGQRDYLANAANSLRDYYKNLDQKQKKSDRDTRS